MASLHPILKASAGSEGLTCRQPARKEYQAAHTACDPSCIPHHTLCTPLGETWRNLSEDLTEAFRKSEEISPDHPAAACMRNLNVVALNRDLEHYQCWVAGEYTRTTVLKGNGFEVMLLCWPPGLFSPVHAHSDMESKIKSNCFLTVLHGQLSETIYEHHQIRADAVLGIGQTRALNAGVTGYINDDVGVHKVGNPSNTMGAISLHVYAPGWAKVQTYVEELTDAGGAPIDSDSWGDF